MLLLHHFKPHRRELTSFATRLTMPEKATTPASGWFAGKVAEEVNLVVEVNIVVAVGK
jgi:hypothetical protein